MVHCSLSKISHFLKEYFTKEGSLTLDRNWKRMYDQTPPIYTQSFESIHAQNLSKLETTKVHSQWVLDTLHWFLVLFTCSLTWYKHLLSFSKHELTYKAYMRSYHFPHNCTYT